MEDPPSVFQCLPYVEVTQDDRGCLEVSSDLLQVDHFVTNDAIELMENRQFRLIGRIDEVINSGGIKIHPQQIERKLSQVLSIHYFIGGVADESLGEKVILAVKHSSSLQLDKILEKVKNCETLANYEVPKSIIVFPDFVETESGKIRRKQTLLLDSVSVLDL
jgi:O-succinylbenzoic acid--CoA ligase